MQYIRSNTLERESISIPSCLIDWRILAIPMIFHAYKGFIELKISLQVTSLDEDACWMNLPKLGYNLHYVPSPTLQMSPNHDI